MQRKYDNKIKKLNTRVKMYDMSKSKCYDSDSDYAKDIKKAC